MNSLFPRNITSKPNKNNINDNNFKINNNNNDKSLSSSIKNQKVTLKEIQPGLLDSPCPNGGVILSTGDIDMTLCTAIRVQKDDKNQDRDQDQNEKDEKNMNKNDSDIEIDAIKRKRLEDFIKLQTQSQAQSQQTGQSTNGQQPYQYQNGQKQKLKPAIDNADLSVPLNKSRTQLLPSQSQFQSQPSSIILFTPVIRRNPLSMHY